MWQLYQFPLCPFTRKVRILLGEKDVGYELIREMPWARRDEFVDLNPAAQTPVMVDAERGTVLIDSMAICEYFEETVDRAAMINGSAANRAEIRRLTTWFDAQFFRDVSQPLIEERMVKRLVLRQSPNRGKGAAVRAGMLAAGGRTLAFTDADLSYPPEQLLGVLAAIEDGWDVAVGSRQHEGTMTVVRAGRLREVGGRIVNVFTGLVLLGRYRDTQCGLKAMRSDVARLVFSRTRIDGFAFDVELSHLVERYRLTLTEVPVQVVNSSRSTVHVVRDAGRLMRDLFRVRAFARLGDYELDVADGLPAPRPPS